MIETWQSRSNTHGPTNLNRKLLWMVWLLFIDVVLIILVLSIEPMINLIRDHFQVKQVKLPTLRESSRGVVLFDRSNHYLCTLYEKRDCHPVALSKISTNMRKALVAAEDRHFYSHCGLDVSAIVRAIHSNYKACRTIEGASTITQQLACNLFLNKNDKSLSLIHI